MNYQNVVIVGTWSIGTNVAREITESQWLGNGHEHPSRLVWLVNSQKIVVPRNSNLVNLIVSGAMTQEQLRVEMWSNWVDREKDAGYEDVIALLEKQWWSMGDIVVIDTTADKRIEAMSFHQEVLARGGKVVTANKNPVSLFEVEKFWNLTRDRRSYRYGASVMAWAPAVTALQRAFDTRNKIKHIEGCFSWTLGFLCSGLDDGKQLSVVLADAIEKKVHRTKSMGRPQWSRCRAKDTHPRSNCWVSSQYGWYHCWTISSERIWSIRCKKACRKSKRSRCRVDKPSQVTQGSREGSPICSRTYNRRIWKTKGSRVTSRNWRSKFPLTTQRHAQ